MAGQSHNILFLRGTAMSIKQDIQDFYGTKDWYKTSWETLKALYGDDAKLFAACLAATSPRQSVKSNWKLAKTAFQLVKIGGGMDRFMLSHQRNLERIRDCWYMDKRMPDRFELSGRKVNSFYQNLIGNWDLVTVDIWMLRFYGYGDRAINKGIYDDVEKRVRRSAKMHGLFPAELQAILWSAIRHKAGHKPATFLIASMDDYQLRFDFMKE